MNRVLIFIILALLANLSTLAQAGGKTKAAQELAEYLIEKFGKEAAEEGAGKLSTRLESLAIKHGDEAFLAIRKAGPRGLKAVEEAGEHAPQVVRLLSREGDKALWVVENPRRLKLFAQYGDEAADAMLKHKGLAEPLVETFQEPAARAMKSLDGPHARELAALADSGELARIGRTPELLNTVATYGDRAMDFVWKNKGALAVTAVLAAFLANPQPFVDGTVDLGSIATEKLAQPVATEAARQADWTWLGVTALAIAGGYAFFRAWLKHKPSTATP